jgi:hypothetical protein
MFTTLFGIVYKISWNINTGWRTKKYPGLHINGNKSFINNKRRTNITLHLKLFLLLLTNVCPRASHLLGGYCDHAARLAVAKTRAGLLIRGRGYFLVPLS